jgi:hypothetical protein
MEAEAPYFFTHFTAPSGPCKKMGLFPAGYLNKCAKRACSGWLHSLQWVEKKKISIYVVNMNFSKFITFQGIIQKILNRSAAHI